MHDLKTAFIILAAGKGSRMKSSKPKVMHAVAGTPMIEILVNSLVNNFSANKSNIFVVVCHQKQQIMNHLQSKVSYVNQEKPLGTADAIKTFISQNPNFKQQFSNIIVLYGDTPLIKHDTIFQIQQKLLKNSLVLLTTKVDNPTGYGRIVKYKNQIQQIVEEKEATEQQKTINLINTGVMGFSCNHLAEIVNKIDNNNLKKEYYLTDAIAIAISLNLQITELELTNNQEAMGANNMIELAKLEQIYQTEQRINLMLSGVKLIEPNSVQIRGEIIAGNDVVIDTNVILSGKIELGNNVKIGSGVILKNITINDNTEILPYCCLEDSILGKNSTIGPFSRMRGGNNLSDNTKIGNFVELKKTTLGIGSKASHLSYLGDTVVGNNTNIGAGTVTCNYDGDKKHKTIIGDNSFVGSNTTLVAPINIYNEVFIAAGSTLTESVKEGKSLAIGRAKQIIKKDWQKKYK